jgi:hypothetical protein
MADQQPAPPRKKCANPDCRAQVREGGYRLCGKHCRMMIAEMVKAGYLEPRPIEPAYRPYSAKEHRHDTNARSGAHDRFG